MFRGFDSNIGCSKTLDKNIGKALKAIEIKDLSFSYLKDANHQFKLLINDFSVDEGELLCILGPNGCGKSTLLKLISSLLHSQSGEVKIFNQPHQKYNINQLARTIAYVKQTNNLIFPFSVYEIVMMGRTPYLNLMGFDKEEDREIVHDAMVTMQVEHLANKGISEISGGEAQRVFIARALAQKSKIILLDEPNAHLDIEHQIMIFELMLKLNKEKGITILTVSHDLNLVGIFSERIILMKNGTIEADGEKSKILTAGNIKKYFNVEASVLASDTSKINVIVNPAAI